MPHRCRKLRRVVIRTERHDAAPPSRVDTLVALALFGIITGIRKALGVLLGAACPNHRWEGSR